MVLSNLKVIVPPRVVNSNGVLFFSNRNFNSVLSLVTKVQFKSPKERDTYSPKPKEDDDCFCREAVCIIEAEGPFIWISTRLAFVRTDDVLSYPLKVAFLLSLKSIDSIFAPVNG